MLPNKHKDHLKILLVQLYSNGDCLYATAVARQIRHDCPNCKLTWAIAPFCKNIISNNPYIDDVLEATHVIKDNVASYRKFKKQLLKQKESGEWDEIFFTNLINGQLANYDGCVRSSIFRGYPKAITVPVMPVLELFPQEKEKVRKFAEEHFLQSFKNVLLFEFAPQSGQSAMTPALAIEIAEALTKDGTNAVVLSSALTIDHPSPGIIDGSSLSIRETAYLTHYCNMLLGSSSGITWISTSSAAKQLPMVQLLNPSPKSWDNPVSRDFDRFGMSTAHLIELVHYDKQLVIACTINALQNFDEAKKEYGQQPPLRFNATKNIVYNLLCYGNFSAVTRHIRINTGAYGYNISFFSQAIAGFLVFPFRLIRNFFKKNFHFSGKP